MAGPVRNVAQAAARIDALFIPDGGDTVPDIVQALANASVNLKKIQLLGTGLWDDPRISSNPALDGGWYAAPDGAGYRGFADRYRARYKQEPGRTATLAYDAVALIAALVKTQGPQRFQHGSPDQSVGLYRHRRPVPLPPRRHLRARARGFARHGLGFADHCPAAAQFWQRNIS